MTRSDVPQHPVRHVVVKQRRPIDPYGDDAHWPLDVAFIVLGSFLLGAALAQQSFGATHFLRSAWSSIVGVPLLVAATIIGSRLIHRRWLRRSMQLALLASLLLHLGLMLGVTLVEMPARSSARLPTRPQVIRERSPRRARDFSSHHLASRGRAQPDFERPVETEQPTPFDLTDRPQSRVDQSPLELQPQPVPEPQDTVLPSLSQRKQAAETAPRRSQQASQLSRNLRRELPTPLPPAAVQSPANAPTPQRLQPAATATRSSSPAATAERQLADTALAPSAAPQAKRTVADVVPQSASPAAALPRQAVERPEPSIAVDNARRSAESQPQQRPVLAADSTDVQRTAEAAPPTAGRPSPEIQQAHEIAQQAERAQNHLQTRQPPVAATPQPLANRQPRRTDRPLAGQSPATAQVAEQVATTPAPPTSTELNATQTPVPRQRAAATSSAAAAGPPPVNPSSAPAVATTATRAASAQLPANLAPPVAPRERSESSASALASAPPLNAALADRVVQRSAPQPSSDSAVRPTDSALARQSVTGTTPTRAQQPLEAPQVSPSTELAANASRRVVQSPVPTLAPQQRPETTPARAALTAELRSPVEADRPAAQVAADTPAVSSSPAPTALQRGSDGVAGIGYSSNLQRSQPAADSPARVASGAARRSRATQSEPEDASLTPSTQGLAGRSRAEAPLPSSQLTPDTQSLAARGTSSGDGQLEASASAALSSAASRAEKGEVSADRGNLQVDLGPQRIVSQLQDGRGSGGGQPALNFAPSATTSRLARSGSQQASIAVDDVAQAVAAPPGQGGAVPLAIDASPSAQQAQRTDEGGSNPVTGEAAIAALSGPAAEAAAADVRGELALQRATASNAASQPDGSLRSQPSVATAPRAAVGPATGVAVDSIAQTPAAPDEQQAAGTPGDAAELAAPGAGDIEKQFAGPSGSGSNEPLPGPAAGGNSAAEIAPQAAIAQRARAEDADAPAGTPLQGGGAQSLQRTARGPLLAPDVLGTAVASREAPVPATSAADDPGDLAAAGVSLTKRRATTILPDGPFNPAPLSAADIGSASGLVSQQPRPSQSASDFIVEGSPSEDSPLQRKRARASEVATARDPSADLATRREEASAGDTALNPPAVAQVAKRSTGITLPVEIQARPGDGGLGEFAAANVGIDDRRAREDSEQVQTRATRFTRRDIGGQAKLNIAPVVATDAFRQRFDRREAQRGGQSSDVKADQAIERGLAFLARQQLEDGRWSLHLAGDEQPAFQSDTAATGLALLAFQGAGYTHRRDRYADALLAAVAFLLESQTDDGCLYLQADENSNNFARLYSHGIATLALCEAYGMTQDPELKEPVQRAIDYIVATQDKRLGGWRYTPGYSSDTSVSGWMMMALKSGQLAGLEIPETTYDGIVGWLDRAQASDQQPHLYRYNPLAPDTPSQRHGLRPSATMTAVGLLMRLYTGWTRTDVPMQRGAEYLRDNLPSLGSMNDPLISRQRDTYYWYYATQVMFHIGGESWRDWNAQLYPLLIGTQIESGPWAGSWDPFEPVPDRWAGHAGRLYVTTMNLLSLEVQYRHLPLYNSEDGR